MEGFTQLSAVVVVIVAICEAVKRVGVSTRYIPLIAVVLGIGGAMYFDGVNWLATGAGIIMALTAQGLYSGFKKTVMNK